jgi:L-lactate dehydrogenase complex protein LldG
MTAREDILQRISSALTDRPDPGPIPRDYRAPGTLPADVDLFAERAADYNAEVHRGVAIAAVLAGRGITRVVVPDGFPDLLDDTIETVREPVTTDTLDSVSAVVTTCAVAIADTGTVVLDHGPGQGRRALSLVPDYHLVVVRPDQIAASVPDAVAALDPTRPPAVLTWISGPSATSDIELSRVEGVHGPRTLDIVITSYLVAGAESAGIGRIASVDRAPPLINYR